MVSVAVALGLVALAVVVPGRGEARWSASTTGTASLTAGEFDTANSYPQHMFNSGLLGYWRLDETSGTQATDSSPDPKHHGAYVNGPALGQPGALVNQTRRSVGFTGSQYVSIPDDGTTFDFTARAQYSVEFWVRPARRYSGSDQWERLVAKQVQDANGIRGWGVNLYRGPNDTNMSIQFERVQGNPLITSRAIAADTWYHVAAVHDGTNMVVYVNGTEAGRVASTDSQQDNTAPLTIGARGNGGDAFVGRIDEVAVFGYALNAGQVSGHANATG
ncbi:LamG domain-containing protein [Cellulomonas sp. S1-8]|uniref:LamG domain-containing protein n=1 Tax=Cellulomonas sp. S1-8 TaxID=2904790 RepID=UPI0022431A22|nr:LamG domain-containing protein [Cellulomonas sp. S1-8]UZN02930.1 LamG domain-containing protein [Cellulomonas sp. S1-8]